ncbi:hypothetical protein LSM04_000438 [Trypanosoma melophagium]|uniref:uncharacterized protein n=1 Tax=Trypanosoma melophagium TaxID=715481 RepID=UPI00351A4B83|nr:hypothetical protein LSM04_000438 [Trypanosoma melophagium]
MRFIKNVCRGASLSTSPYHISRGSLVRAETPSHDAFPYYLLQREVASILVYSSFTGTSYGNNGVTRRWRYGEKIPGSTIRTTLSIVVRHCATVAKQPGEQKGIGGEMAEAEALLRERFGPQAKLVLRRSPKRRLRRNSTVAVTQPIQEGGDGEEEDVVH